MRFILILPVFINLEKIIKMNTKQNEQAIALQLENTQNPFAAFSASSMMMVVKKDLLGMGDDQMSSSPTAPGGW